MSVTSDLASLLLAWVVGVGPVALSIALLNRWDRRARALLDVVAAALPADALRTDVAITVRCALLGRHAAVRVDLRGGASPRLWETAVRLRGVLPPRVGLTVEGWVEEPVAPSRPVRLTLEDGALRPAA